MTIFRWKRSALSLPIHSTLAVLALAALTILPAAGRPQNRISSAEDHAFIIREDGNIYGTGSNSNYNLGIGNNTEFQYVYRPGSTPNSWLHVVAMLRGGIAIRSDSTLWGWGSGATYAFGNNDTSTLTIMTQLGSEKWLFATASKNSPPPAACFITLCWQSVPTAPCGPGGATTPASWETVQILPAQPRSR